MAARETYAGDSNISEGGREGVEKSGEAGGEEERQL